MTYVTQAEVRHKNPSRYMLPQRSSDDRQRARKGRLQRLRDDYNYKLIDAPGHGDPEFSLPPGLESLPKTERFSIEERARVFSQRLRVGANGVLARLAPGRLKSPESYERLFPVLMVPSSRRHWSTNDHFSRLRLAGPNPHSLRRCDRLGQGALREAASQVISRAHPGATLDGALGEGRIFSTAYPWLDDPRVQREVQTARRSYLSSPNCLFYATRTGSLQPLAIQEKVGSGPVATPMDRPNAWLLAKAHAQCADLHYQTAIHHLLETHMVSGVFRIAAARRLHPDHPLSQLLAPHFEFTLAANDRLFGGRLFGLLDRTFAARAAGIFDLARLAWSEWDFSARALTSDLASRGVDDREVLPQYWYRDDALDIWDATNRYVKGVLGSWYRSDEDVREDYELEGWLRELGAESGGQVRGLPDVSTTRALFDFVTEVIFRATAGHAAATSSQFDEYAFLPNASGALLSPFPTPGSDSDLADALPGRSAALAQIALLGSLAGEKRTSLMRPRARPALGRDVAFDAYHAVGSFRRALASCQSRVEVRNRALDVPYGNLAPMRIPASTTL